MNEKKNRIKEAFISSLNKARCLNNRHVGNEELAGILLNALPKDILEAIERDTPKQLLNACRGIFECPSCRKVIPWSGHFSAQICERCGQRLDWSSK